jgi:hypothetical protein
MSASQAERLLERVRAEYLEMPGLRLRALNLTDGEIPYPRAAKADLRVEGNKPAA